MASLAWDDMAFTEMGICPRAKGLMGILRFVPPFLLTSTSRKLAIWSPGTSGKTNSKEALYATVTVT